MLLPVIPMMVIMVSAAQNSSPPTFSGAVNVVNYAGVSIAHYALTQMVVVITYLRLYLLPYGQNVDPAPPLYTLPYQLPVIGAALIIAFLVGGSYLLYRRNRDDVRCILVFVGVCWYFLALAVSSSFIPLPDLMAEHRAYFPSVGFIMALICLMDFLRTELGTARKSGLIVIGTAVWCVMLSVLTYNRNHVWQSGVHLWSDAVKKSPAKDRPWHNLGSAYATAGNYQEATKCFRKVIEINPGWGNAYVLLAVSYLELKRYQEAVEASLRGIDVDPANPVNYNNLGIAYAELDRDDDAKQAFSTALALRPGYENARFNLDRLESFMETEVDRRR
jgi:tetratricopeptide (TPR) repeat protein